MFIQWTIWMNFKLETHYNSIVSEHAVRMEVSDTGSVSVICELK